MGLCFMSTLFHESNLICFNYICVLVSQFCPTLCDPMDCSPPGSSVHEISQATTLEWGAFHTPGDLPSPGIKHRSPALREESLLLSQQGGGSRYREISRSRHKETKPSSQRQGILNWEARGKVVCFSRQNLPNMVEQRDPPHSADCSLKLPTLSL